MTKFATAAAICALSLGSAGPGLAQQADTVVATVNGTEITLGHMIAMRERLPQQYQSLDDAALYEGILEQLVQQIALGQDRQISPRAELVLENERRALVASDRLEEIGADAASPEAIRQYYEATYAASDEGSVEYNASHILVETQDDAQALVDQLGNGADFAELARQNSIGPSGPSGGELGWFGPGTMVPAFEQAVRDMEPGRVAAPVETQFGWHVIRLNETRQTDVPPLEDVQGDIAEQLRAEAVQTAIDGAMDQARVERARNQPAAAVIRNDALLAE